MFSDSQFADIWAEDHGRLQKCEHLYSNITPAIQASCISKIKRGCSRDIRPDLPQSQIDILEKVKRLMSEILELYPRVKTLFLANSYPAYLEGR